MLFVKLGKEDIDPLSTYLVTNQTQALCFKQSYYLQCVARNKFFLWFENNLRGIILSTANDFLLLRRLGDFDSTGIVSLC